jgi:cytochrome bd-type quinol oxidase subunit 2
LPRPSIFVLRRRRAGVYRAHIAAVMRPEELEAFAHLRDVANAWALVAAGASLIAAKETWELHEQYHWAEWTFWALVVLMLLICAARVAFRAQRVRSRWS